jgi:hypothetical protein
LRLLTIEYLSTTSHWFWATAVEISQFPKNKPPEGGSDVIADAVFRQDTARSMARFLATALTVFFSMLAPHFTTDSRS